MRTLFHLACLIIVILVMTTPASAWFKPGGGGGGGGCTASFNFAQSCNSAYIAVIL